MSKWMSYHKVDTGPVYLVRACENSAEIYFIGCQQPLALSREQYDEFVKMPEKMNVKGGGV